MKIFAVKLSIRFYSCTEISYFLFSKEECHHRTDAVELEIWRDSQTTKLNVTLSEFSQ